MTNAERQARHREKIKNQTYEQLDKEVHRIRQTLHRCIDRLSERQLYAFWPLLVETVPSWVRDSKNDKALIDLSYYATECINPENYEDTEGNKDE